MPTEAVLCGGPADGERLIFEGTPPFEWLVPVRRDVSWRVDDTSVFTVSCVYNFRGESPGVYEFVGYK